MLRLFAGLTSRGNVRLGSYQRTESVVYNLPSTLAPRRMSRARRTRQKGTKCYTPRPPGELCTTWCLFIVRAEQSAIMNQLYIYVDGSDLEDVVVDLVSALHGSAEHWSNGAARLVNQQQPRTPDLLPDDLPQWDLGLNLPATALSKADSAELISFLTQLSAVSGRDFVIGLWKPELAISEDLCFVDAKAGLQQQEFLVQVLGLL